MTELRVAFYFDLVCPWCWIGLRQLNAAHGRLQASHPDIALQIDYRSFPLLPEIPSVGVPYQEFYARRFADPEALAQRRAQVQRAGEGIVPPFRFDRIERMPNSLLAHHLLDCARLHGGTGALLEVLFSAFFIDGVDIGCKASLLTLAQTVLPAGDELVRWLDMPGAGKALLRNALESAPLDIHGVPHLVFDRDNSLPGLVSVDVLHQWLGKMAVRVSA